MSLCIRLPELMEMDVNTVLQAIADLKVVHQRLEVLKNLPEHFSENVIKAGAMNRNSWKSKNIIVLRYCWDSMWQSRFFCTILRETCQKPERWQTAHDKTGFQNHGLGLRNIEVCAEKYYGKTEVTVREDEFELAVVLQERIE